MTESEWWLCRTTGSEDVIEPRGLLSARYPHLGRGFQLADERSSDRFTVFDGWIPRPGPELDLTGISGPPVSASRLRTSGDCPLRYFFRYVLEIQPPDKLKIDADFWLDPLAPGSLLHEVFGATLQRAGQPHGMPTPSATRACSRARSKRASTAIEKRSRPRARPCFGGKSRNCTTRHESSYVKRKRIAGKPATSRCSWKFRSA